MTTLLPINFDSGLIVDLGSIALTSFYLLKLLVSNEKTDRGGRLSLGEKIFQFCFTPKRSLLRQHVAARRLAS